MSSSFEDKTADLLTLDKFHEKDKNQQCALLKCFDFSNLSVALSPSPLITTDHVQL